MQLRHIRPGSLEWQDAKVEEGKLEAERLTPEETIRLRRLSDDRRRSAKTSAQTLAKTEQSKQTEVQQ